jgi:hypothetical protein
MIIYSSKQLQPRRERDYYPTPIELATEAVRVYKSIFPQPVKKILDPGAGDGVWGRAAYPFYPTATYTGVEINPENKIIFPYMDWWIHDFLTFESNMKYNLILGNPPYKHIEKFIEKSYSLLADGGHILFLLRLAFLEGQQRHASFYTKELRPKRVFVSTRRISFRGDRKSDSTAYAMFLWEKDYKLPVTLLDWLSWEYNDGKDSDNEPR